MASSSTDQPLLYAEYDTGIRRTGSSLRLTGESLFQAAFSGELPRLTLTRQSDLPAAPPLKSRHIASYGVGHHLNDLCAACWFTYLLIYLESDLIGLTQISAGIVLLSGQLADALTTPLVGWLSDTTPPSCQSSALGLGPRHNTQTPNR